MVVSSVGYGLVIGYPAGLIADWLGSSRVVAAAIAATVAVASVILTWIFFETTLVIGLSVAASITVAVYFLWGSTKPGRAQDI